MKATGIVRRIDDLGRVVIPKEIRRTMRIREGDPLEIFISREGEVIFKKYSAMEDMNGIMQIFADSFSKFTGRPVAVCDGDSIVAVSGISKKEYVDRTVSDGITELMLHRRDFLRRPGVSSKIPLISDNNNLFCDMVCPIISESDCVGALISIAPENGDFPDEKHFEVCKSYASIIGKQME